MSGARSGTGSVLGFWMVIAVELSVKWSHQEPGQKPTMCLGYVLSFCFLRLPYEVVNLLISSKRFLHGLNLNRVNLFWLPVCVLTNYHCLFSVSQCIMISFFVRFSLQKVCLSLCCSFPFVSYSIHIINIFLSSSKS